MSIIFAIFRRDGERVEPQEIDAMLDAERQHSFDGQHIWRDSCVALAHQHLWVTPEEQGEQQPLAIAGGRYAISFDGRLDNREELQNDLSLSPATPITDASIVLHAYVAWGNLCVRKLFGDFAFVVWDRDERRLFLGRDSLGVRPIAYYCDAHRCVVASTVAPILAHPQVASSINEGKIGEYIVQYDLNQEESFFSGVLFCPPAHWLSVTEVSVHKRRYWIPELDHRIRYKDSREYVEQFQDIFFRSVADRLRIEGRAGVSLSSGMDSSSVTALAHNELLKKGETPPGGLNTYTLTFDGLPDIDESVNVREFATNFHLNCSFLRADNRPLLDNLPLPFMAPDYLIYLMTNPLMWQLYRRMHEDGVRVALNGAYGDTLFTRQRYWATDVVQDRAWRLALDALVPCTLPHRQADLRLAGRSARSLGRQLLRHRTEPAGRSVSHQEMLTDSGITSALVEAIDLSVRVQQNALQRYWGRSEATVSLTTMHWNYFVHSSSLLLQGAQKLGLDRWDPYRDRRLVEFMMAIPTYLSGRPGRGNNKWILREAMRGILPENARTQPRQTGPAPWASAWFGGDEARGLSSILRNALVIQYGYYDPVWVTRRLEVQRRRPGYDSALWRCVCLEIWLRTYGPEA